MDEPTTVRVTDGGILRAGLGAAAAGMTMLLVVLLVVFATTDAGVGDLLLPGGAIALFWALWSAIAALRSTIVRRQDRKAIERLLGDENAWWATMRFPPDEWHSVVESRYAEPDGDPWFGIALALGIGVVLAGFVTLVGWLATEDRTVSAAFPIGGLGVVVFFGAVAAIQPLWQRRVRARARTIALKVDAPGIWFGADGVYHETDGFTSLTDLVSITDRTKTTGALVFTISTRVVMSAPGGSQTVGAESPVDVEIPTAHRAEAGALSRRYRDNLSRRSA